MGIVTLPGDQPAPPIGNRPRSSGTLDDLTCGYAWRTYKERILELITANRYRTVADIGGGRKPLFSREEVEALGLQYTIIDISQSELDCAPSGYRKVCADICQLGPDVGERFDFMFSVYLMEHAADARAMHRNIYAMLNPGGRAFHYFPTLYSPVFVINRFTPNRLTHLVKQTLDPRQRGVPTFPARYSWCFGPTATMERRFAQLGYEIEAYEPFYGTDYLTKLPIVAQLDGWLTRWAARHRNRYLTSYAFLILRKPPSE